jgi:hypothetical protein
VEVLPFSRAELRKMYWHPSFLLCELEGTKSGLAWAGTMSCRQSVSTFCLHKTYLDSKGLLSDLRSVCMFLLRRGFRVINYDADDVSGSDKHFFDFLARPAESRNLFRCLHDFPVSTLSGGHTNASSGDQLRTAISLSSPSNPPGTNFFSRVPSIRSR